MKNALWGAVMCLVILAGACDRNGDASAEQRKRKLCREMNEHMAELVLQRAQNMPAADRQKHKDNLAAAGNGAMNACLERSEKSIECVTKADSLEAATECESR